MRSKPCGDMVCAPPRIRSCSLMTATLSGAFSAICLASSSVKVSISAAGTTVLIRPWRSARMASIGRAVKIISFAILSPVALSSVSSPPTRLGRPAPDAAFDHGDHGAGKILDLAHELAQRIVPAERVATRLRQLGHVMPRREHLDALPRAEDDRSQLRFAERAQSRDRLFDQRMAERVAAALVVEGDGADILHDFSGDVGHPGAPSFVYPKVSACSGEVDPGSQRHFSARAGQYEARARRRQFSLAPMVG